MIPFFFSFFSTTSRSLSFYLTRASEYCDLAPIGSSLVLDVVVVFEDMRTAVVIDVETCMMGMQGKETVERLTLLRAQWANV